MHLKVQKLMERKGTWFYVGSGIYAWSILLYRGTSEVTNSSWRVQPLSCMHYNQPSCIVWTLVQSMLRMQKTSSFDFRIFLVHTQILGLASMWESDLMYVYVLMDFHNYYPSIVSSMSLIHAPPFALYKGSKL